MKIQVTLKVLCGLTGFLLLSGCKLAALNPEGGEVQSVGSGTCLVGSVCTHAITNTNYSETFTAVPNAGWTFVKWNSGDDFLCGGSTNPVCVVSNIPFAGNPAIEAVVDSNYVFYIMPIFTQ